MSVSIYWRIVDKSANPLPGTSSTLETLRAAFSVPDGPIRLGGSDVSNLRAMQVAISNDPFSGKHGSFGELADAIETHGEIEVWGEW